MGTPSTITLLDRRKDTYTTIRIRLDGSPNRRHGVCEVLWSRYKTLDQVQALINRGDLRWVPRPDEGFPDDCFDHHHPIEARVYQGVAEWITGLKRSEDAVNHYVFDTECQEWTIVTCASIGPGMFDAWV